MKNNPEELRKFASIITKISEMNLEDDFELKITTDILLQKPEECYFILLYKEGNPEKSFKITIETFLNSEGKFSWDKVRINNGDETTIVPLSELESGIYSMWEEVQHCE